MPPTTPDALSRRRFLALAGLSAASTAIPSTTLPAGAQFGVARPGNAPDPHILPTAYTLVAATDRARILRLAAEWLAAPPQTITSFVSPRSPGTPHDFFSEADYFWPDTEHPNRPYKNIDGRSNPDNFLEHRRVMIRFSQAVAALTAAWLLTRRQDFADAAARHLLAWFVTPATRMNPDLRYAQGIRNGGPTGRSYGIIDTLHLVEVARAASHLRPAPGSSTGLTPAQFAAIQGWFRDYITWLKTSDPGQKERDALNNHSIAYALQVAEFARLADDNLTRIEVRDRLLLQQIPAQMNPDGSFPREIARTKPYGYSIFVLDCAVATGWTLSDLGDPQPATPFSPATPTPAATPFNPNAKPAAPGALLRFRTPNNRSLCLGVNFLAPFLADKSRWPYPHDIQHWDSWPVRSPSLLFAGIACSNPAWLTLWRRLNPDPTDPEVIRNFPLRQPLLWV